MLDISNYNLKLVHVPGKELARPDALSRRPDLINKNTNDNDQVTLLPKSLFINIINTCSRQNSKILRKGPHCIKSTTGP